MNIIPSVLLISFSGIMFSSCGTDSTQASSPIDNRTPATDTTITKSTLEEFVEVNATSAFLQKSYVKANATGYLEKVNTDIGQFVPKGKLLFVIKTKEAQSLGNTVNALDSSFQFSGIVKIFSNGFGYITKLNHQPGDYVQDGEELAVVSDLKSFVFLLSLPYELGKLASLNTKINLTLPDGIEIDGILQDAMPTVDPVAQTQSYIIKVSSKALPEGLIAKVRLIKKSKPNAVSLPKQAVLTDELQRSFWVMKMIDSETAVKIPVIKGIEAADRVEIVSPLFTESDRILLTGNFGLPDTAKVVIQNK